MKYGRATTDLHAKSNMHHQKNIAICADCLIDRKNQAFWYTLRLSQEVL